MKTISNTETRILSTTTASVAVANQLHRRAIVVLPAYNEELSLPPLLDAFEKDLKESGLDLHVVIVDDGSTDETARVASAATFRLPITLVSHDKNRGLAAALRTGLETAVSQAGPDDLIVTMDADNTHPPSLLPRMVALVADGHDVVIASRFQRGSEIVGVPWHRNWLSIAARGLFTVAFPIRGVRDYTCGYRVYKATVIERALQEFGDDFVSEQGFSCMVDVLLKLRHQRIVFGEVPMVLRYDQKGGASKMRVARTAMQTLSLIARRRLDSPKKKPCPR